MYATISTAYFSSMNNQDAEYIFISRNARGRNKKGKLPAKAICPRLVAPALPTSNQILEDLKTLGDFG